MDHEQLVTGRWLGQFLKMMGAASGVALAPATIPMRVASRGGSFRRQIDF
jgi:hypothetical protein